MEGEIDIRAIFGLLRRQLRLIIVTVVVILGLATLIVFTMTPIYSATTLVMVDTSSKNLLDPSTDYASSSADNARVDGEVELARSDNVLLSVIDKEKLTSDPEFGPKLGFMSRVLSFLRIRQPTLPTGQEALNQTLTQLGSMVTVQRRGLTYLISIGARSEDPKRAAELANAVAASYIESQLSSKVDSTLKSRDVLQARIGQARDAIVASEGSFDSFINDNLNRIVKETGNDDIKNLQAQVSQLSTLRQQTAANADAVQASIDSQDYGSLAAKLADQATAELEKQRQDIVSRLDTSDAASPAAIDLRNQLADINSRLTQSATSQVTSLRQQITDTQTKEGQLRQDIRSAILKSNLSADVLTQIYDLQQNAEIARRQYETLLGRSQDLEAQSALQIADSRIVSPAMIPSSAAWPNTRLILILAGLAAVGIGIGLAFLYENFIGGFTTEEQAASILRAKVVSTIPRQKMTRTDQVSLSDNLVANPLSVFSESVRRVRAAVDQATRKKKQNEDSGGTVLMVTSTSPNEGKTTVALSLARSYALSGQTTLLIDCDLRKPSIHRQLGLEPSQGLIDYLSSTGTPPELTSIMSTDPLTGLTTMVGSRRSDIPTDQLLAGRSFQKLLTAARKIFDVIVLDTPPLGPVVDGMYIAPHADAVVFVVRWASTPQSDVRKAMNILQTSKGDDTEILSIINQQEMSAAAYYNKYGGYYSEAN